MKYTCDIRRCPQGLAAAVLGITDRGLRKGRAPRNRDGTYHLGKLLKWRLAEVEAKYAETAGSKDNPELERLRAANAQLRELDLAERRGELVSAVDVAQEVQSGTRALTEALLGLSATLTPQLAGRPEAEVSEVLDETIRGLLGDLSARFRGMEEANPVTAKG